MIGAAQNPDELFDVVDAAGRPTGVQKRRADVHRDGDWHRSIHIWVVSRIDGVDLLLLQRRSLAKDTAAGLLDPTVGGHLTAGETWRDALREAEEEIGLPLAEADVVYAGTRRGVGLGPGDAVDYEIQDVYFARNDQPLAAYRPNQAELAGLVRIQLDHALSLCAGEIGEAPVEVLDASSGQISTGTLRRSEVTRQLDRYIYRVAIAARAFLAGERHFSV